MPANQPMPRTTEPHAHDAFDAVLTDTHVGESSGVHDSASTASSRSGRPKRKKRVTAYVSKASEADDGVVRWFDVA